MIRSFGFGSLLVVLCAGLDSWDGISADRSRCRGTLGGSVLAVWIGAEVAAAS